MAEFAEFAARSVSFHVEALFPVYSRGHMSVASVHAARERLRVFVANDAVIATAYLKTVVSHTFNNDAWGVEITVSWDAELQENVPSVADIVSTYGAVEHFFHGDPLLNRTNWRANFDVVDYGHSL